MQIADVINNSRKQSAEGTSDGGLVSPKGRKRSADCLEPTAVPLTESSAHKIDELQSDFNSPQAEPCTHTEPNPLQPDTLAPPQGGAAAGVVPLFSFAALPVKPVSFGGKAAARSEGTDAATLATSEKVDIPVGTSTAAAPAVGKASSSRSMASMLSAPATGASAKVSKKLAVKTMAGMFAAPAFKVPKPVHQLQVVASGPNESITGNDAVLANAEPDGSSPAAKDCLVAGSGEVDAQGRSGVRAAMDALREQGSEEKCNGPSSSGGDAAADGNSSDGEDASDELASVRDRYHSNKRQLCTTDDKKSPAKRRSSGDVLGDVTTIPFKKSKQMDGKRGRKRGHNTDVQEAFDYDAVLDGSDRYAAPSRRAQSGGARGGRGRGQGRGRSGARHTTSGRKKWNPFQVSEADVKPAKRSGNNKSGNRSGAF